MNNKKKMDASVVAIAMALADYRQDFLQDATPMKLTIKRPEQFSPWSSKTALLREKPNLVIY